MEELGTGVLDWERDERISDRYGMVRLFDQPGQPFRKFGEKEMIVLLVSIRATCFEHEGWKAEYRGAVAEHFCLPGQRECEPIARSTKDHRDHTAGPESFVCRGDPDGFLSRIAVLFSHRVVRRPMGTPPYFYC